MEDKTFCLGIQSIAEFEAKAFEAVTLIPSELAC